MQESDTRILWPSMNYIYASAVTFRPDAQGRQLPSNEGTAAPACGPSQPRPEPGCGRQRPGRAPARSQTAATADFCFRSETNIVYLCRRFVIWGILTVASRFQFKCEILHHHQTTSPKHGPKPSTVQSPCVRITLKILLATLGVQ